MVKFGGTQGGAAMGGGHGEGINYAVLKKVMAMLAPTCTIMQRSVFSKIMKGP